MSAGRYEPNNAEREVEWLITGSKEPRSQLGID
jgi:hypothetical protein